MGLVLHDQVGEAPVAGHQGERPDRAVDRTVTRVSVAGVTSGMARSPSRGTVDVGRVRYGRGRRGATWLIGMVGGRPQVLDGVGPPRPPALGPAPQRARRRAGPAARPPVGPAEVAVRERVRVAQCPHGHHLDRPRADAGQRRQYPAGLRSRSHPGPRSRRPVAERVDHAGERARPAPGSAGFGALAAAPADGKRWVRPAVGSVDGLAVGRHQAAAAVRAAAVDTCWPSTARTANSAPSTVRGTRRPGAAPPPEARGRVGAERPVDGLGIGVQVEQSAATGDRRGQVGHVGEVHPAGDVVGRGGERHHARAVGQSQCAAVGGADHLLHPGHRGGRQVAEEVVRAERPAERQPQDERARRPVGRTAARRSDGPAGRWGARRTPTARCR